ncbi:MAG TPA: peroxiredoxin family protein, partial [Longimicrobiaceae bacterium]|nr:peroxiredoxin family protein [Longimicrobiaceae bacterium]
EVRARGYRSLFPLLALLLLAGCERPGGTIAADPSLPVGIETGNRAPPLVGSLAGGERFQLEPDRRSQATVLVFYRGLHCGLCRERLRELEAHRGAYRDAGARVFAVTLDSPEEAARTPEQLGLGFPIVRVDSAALAEWGVLDDNGRRPLPASVLLDRQGVIRYRHVGRNAADRARDVELLVALQSLLAE